MKMIMLNGWKSVTLLFSNEAECNQRVIKQKLCRIMLVFSESYPTLLW